jgi:hypothetical protein
MRRLDTIQKPGEQALTGMKVKADVAVSAIPPAPTTMLLSWESAQPPK